MNLKKDLQKVKKMSDEFDKISDYVGIDTKIGEWMCQAIDNYVHLLVDLYEKEEENSWIEWFIYETKFGKQDLHCYIEGKKYEITNINSFVKFFDKHIQK